MFEEALGLTTRAASPPGLMDVGRTRSRGANPRSLRFHRHQVHRQVSTRLTRDVAERSREAETGGGPLDGTRELRSPPASSARARRPTLRPPTHPPPTAPPASDETLTSRAQVSSGPTLRGHRARSVPLVVHGGTRVGLDTTARASGTSAARASGSLQSGLRDPAAGTEPLRQAVRLAPTLRWHRGPGLSPGRPGFARVGLDTTARGLRFEAAWLR